jgi:hypothetical protein
MKVSLDGTWLEQASAWIRLRGLSATWVAQRPGALPTWTMAQENAMTDKAMAQETP